MVSDAPPPPNRAVTEITAAMEDFAHRFNSLSTRAQQNLDTRVSGPQIQALEIIEHHERINVNGLAAELGAIPSSASRLCDRMQAAGLIARTSSAANRREVLLVLTKAGRDLLDRISTSRRSMLADIVAGMSEEARSDLLTGLRAFTRTDRSRDDRRRLA